MYVVALTGRMGSGKSQVRDLFASHGASIFDADKSAREFLATDDSVHQCLQEHFPDIFQTDGNLDRSLLAQAVFADAKKRKLLESCLHPLVREAIRNWAQSGGSAYGVVEIPVFTPENRLTEIDRVCVVDAPEKVCYERVRARDGRSDEQIRAILAAQLSREAFLDLSDDVINNSSGIKELERQVATLHALYSTLDPKEV